MNHRNYADLSLDNVSLSTYSQLIEAGVKIKEMVELISINDHLTPTRAKTELNYFRKKNDLIGKTRMLANGFYEYPFR